MADERDEATTAIFVPPGWDEENWPIRLDDDHLLSPTTRHGEHAGYLLAIRHADGTWCLGTIPLRGHGAGNAEWDLVSSDPITLSPSILQKPCGCHGFVRDGKWVSA